MNQANALAAVFQQMYEITWVCEKDHHFSTGRVRDPGQCPTCKTPLVKPIMFRRTKPLEKKSAFKLSGLESEALARIT